MVGAIDRQIVQHIGANEGEIQVQLVDPANENQMLGQGYDLSASTNFWNLL